MNNTIDKRIIAWEKWRDPFGSDIDEAHWPGAFGNVVTDTIIEDAKGEYFNEDEYEDEELEEANEEHMRQTLVKNNKRKTRIMITPNGVIPITEHTAAGKLFNFWTAHTNFRMTKKIKKIISRTDGVETLDLLTPYRWRISIGKVFDAQLVKDQVSHNLGARPSTECLDEH